MKKIKKVPKSDEFKKVVSIPKGHWHFICGYYLDVQRDECLKNLVVDPAIHKSPYKLVEEYIGHQQINHIDVVYIAHFLSDMQTDSLLLRCRAVEIIENEFGDLAFSNRHEIDEILEFVKGIRDHFFNPDNLRFTTNRVLAENIAKKILECRSEFENACGKCDPDSDFWKPDIWKPFVRYTSKTSYPAVVNYIGDGKIPAPIPLYV